MKVDSTASTCTIKGNGTDNVDGSNTFVLPATQFAAANLIDNVAGAWGIYSATPSGGGAQSNKFVSAISNTGAATLSQPAFSNLSGNPTVLQMPVIQRIGTPTQATNASQVTTLAVPTVGGGGGAVVSVGDCLMMCITNVTKATSQIATLTGWTQLVVAGELTDGTNQPQAAIFSRVVDGTENATYSPTWSGSAFPNASEIALRGLAQCTSVDATYSVAPTATSQAVQASTPSSGNFSTAEVNINCGQSSAGNRDVVQTPPPLVSGPGTAGASMGFGLGYPGAYFGVGNGGSASRFVLAGVLMH